MTSTFAELLPAGPAPIAAELRRELEEPRPWMYPWPLRDGTLAPVYSDELDSVHRTRREMIEPAVRAAIAAAGPEARVLDLGCNEGLFAHLARAWGAARVVGCDIRELNIRRAEAIRDHYGISPAELEFRCVDAFALDTVALGSFDVVLALGLVYHLEDPVGALRIARRLVAPGGLCVVESQLTRQDEPIVHGWGTSDHWERAEASFAARFENDPADPLASVDGVLSLIPNAAALELAMRVAGFRRVRWLDPASHHNSQYVLRDRGIVTGRPPTSNGEPVIEILAASPWQMTFGERAALEGILSQLRPGLAIEIGTAEGGSLARLARHSERVHSFDLVRPTAAAAQLENVTLHTGDSHALLPELLAELTAAGTNVDFVLVDGDHTAAGVERDVRDLLASPALRRTIVILHDALNDDVREGLERIDYAAEPKVVYVDLDFVGGHLSDGGPFHHQLWGGLGLLVLDDGGEPLVPLREEDGRFYELFELIAPVRDELVARERSGGADGPGARGEAEAVAEDATGLRAELERTRGSLDSIRRSASWRVTAPLRNAKRLLRSRGGQR
ncbi:MAG: hypothetical protein JWN32_1871 [Solirubrobacterales bacterium]|nr:hypothetical protein [Solirubrobacterales bacterium]